MITAKNPGNCAYCGYYMTNDEKYAGQRCIDPTHWQAAGKLASHDFYTMARLVAGAGAELAQRPIKRVVLAGQTYSNEAATMIAPASATTQGGQNRDNRL